MQTNYDVVIVGAGPVGITTACTLKAIKNDLNICVLDKRPTPQRNHGLLIQSDAIAAVSNILKPVRGNAHVASLQRIYSSWNGHFIRTNDIETKLQKQAETMGITVLRDKAYEISKGDIGAVLDAGSASNLSEKQKKIQNICKHARVIIAADGSHSVVREELGIPLIEKENLQYLVELKYQTNGKTQPRGYKEASLLSSKVGYVAAETMNQRTGEEKKPATFLLFVNETTYNCLREKDAQGKIKGVYGNSWTLKELREKNDPQIQKVSKSFEQYLEHVKSRGGSCSEEKIATLEMKIYRSKESAKMYKGKHVLLVGDANSGLVLQRGFNKGLKEAALCAQAVRAFFNKPSSVTVPSEFRAYQKQTQRLFRKERGSIRRKNFFIKAAQVVVGSTAFSKRSAERLETSSLESASFMKDVFSRIGNFFSKIFDSSSTSNKRPDTNQ